MGKTATKRRKRRTVTPAMQARSAASKAAANELLHNYAVACLNNPEEFEAYRQAAASLGWKLDPASSEPGYSLLNIALLLAQRPGLTHCAGFRDWHAQGRQVAVGEQALGTFRRIGRKKTDEAEDKPKDGQDGEEKTGRNRGYYVKRGTFDVSQTVPRERCPHCGTEPDGTERSNAQCPPTCSVFLPREGVLPPREYVMDLLLSQISDDEPEDGDA
ncbi:ArdC-like ssDNA-binding domain-containing protein [Nonomuraea bangladeshensis]|uniref:ArdC-like ssDNA-binding domain-containing protein n=1 Tax=Nonomuraea bangladeshensis TaxID=404385 RepID=UPI0031CF91EB